MCGIPQGKQYVLIDEWICCVKNQLCSLLHSQSTIQPSTSVIPKKNQNPGKDARALIVRKCHENILLFLGFVVIG